MIRHIIMSKFRQQNKKEHMQFFEDMQIALKDMIVVIKFLSVGIDINNSTLDMALV
ncbi:MAG: hypothetical protein KAQ68_09130 [Clostridiales bacterium]|nr:hypothetical protein [Clostridiales bacterium]